MGEKRVVSEETRRKMSEAKRGKNNPNYGKTHSEEIRQKMRDNHADFSGENNPFYKFLEENPEERAKLAERTRLYWESLTEEERQEVNYRNSLGQCNSEYSKTHANYTGHVTGFYEGYKCGRVLYRSSWELQINEFLTAHDKVASYKTEFHTIDYLDSNGNKRASRSDFFVTLTDGREFLLEVKPLALLALNNNAQKIAAYSVWCEERGYGFAVLCEDHFKKGKSLYNIFNGYLNDPGFNILPYLRETY